MLDVHPPHEAAHSWRDFFIHIATSVVGLLIAIGLEQTVEHFHHRFTAPTAHGPVSLQRKGSLPSNNFLSLPTSRLIRIDRR
jgi:hypothetical protein